MLIDESRGGDGEVAPPFAVEGVEPDVVVYFFDGGKDCSTCDKLEAYAREAVETHFGEELASGALQWRRLDMDEPVNEHFVTDYGLYAKSVVLVGFEGGEERRWKNLEDIWELVYDRPAYLEYIRAETRGFMDAAP